VFSLEHVLQPAAAAEQFQHASISSAMLQQHAALPGSASVNVHISRPPRALAWHGIHERSVQGLHRVTASVDGVQCPDYGGS
jgi:hypothetical protein